MTRYHLPEFVEREADLAIESGDGKAALWLGSLLIASLYAVIGGVCLGFVLVYERRFETTPAPQMD
jgi:hypothetical protein